MDPNERRKVFYQRPVREHLEEANRHNMYRERYHDPNYNAAIRAPPVIEDGVYMHDPNSFDLHYAFQRKNIEKDAHRLLRAIKDEQKAPEIQLHRHEDMRKENNWLKAIERQAHANVRPSTPQFIRKILATFYTWEERRIYFHVFRSDFNYDHIKKVVAQNAPYTSESIDILAVTVGTDRIEPFQPSHLKLDTKMFLICTPTLFVLRIKHKDSSDLLLSTSPLETVGNIKTQIYKLKCFPIHRMDLIFNGHCMDNGTRLFTYDLRDGSIVHMFLQPGCYMHVKITAFWKKVYDLEIDYTATAKEIIIMVLKQCMTSAVGEYYINENYIHPHFLVLHSPHHYYFGMDEGVYRILLEENTLHLVISQRESAHKVTLRVKNCPEGDEYIKVDSEGHYGVAYMNLHGITNIEIDRMTLKIPGKTLNPYDGVKEQEDGTTVELLMSDKQDLLPKNTPLKIVLRSGLILPIKVNMRQDVSDVLTEIDRLGIRNAEQYNIYRKHQLLPANASLIDADIEANDFIHLCAHYYPIDIVQLKGFKKPIKVQCSGKISRLKLKADEYFPPQYGKTQYMFGGRDMLRVKKVEELKLFPGCAVFQEIIEEFIVVQIVYKDDTVVLEFEPDDFSFLVREKFAHWNMQMSAMDSLEQLLVWIVTRPSYTESRPTAKPIKLTEEIIDNPSLRPEIDWEKYKPIAVNEKKAFRLGLNSARRGEIITLPPVVLYDVPIATMTEKNDGIATMLYKREKQERKEKNRRKAMKEKEALAKQRLMEQVDISAVIS